MDKNSNEYKALFKSQEERIFRNFKNEITLLDIEFGNTDCIKDAIFTLRHNCEKCGNSIYKREATKLFKRKTVGCINCKDPKYIKNYRFNILKNRLVENNLDNEFSLIDITKQENGTHWIMTLQHNCEECKNNIFQVSVENFFNNGTRCPKCRKLSFTEFKHKFETLNPDYILNSNEIDYQTTKLKVSIMHNCHECGFTTWDAAPNNLIYGNHRASCPVCSRKNSNGKSLGEESIIEYCSTKSIQYDYQYFQRIPNVKNAMFDFNIKDIIVEYDGSTHFKDSFNDPSKLIKQKDCDKRKTQWCLDNCKHFLRIPYTEFNNIEKILDIILFEKNHHLLSIYDVFYINHSDMILVYNEDGIYSDLIKSITI